MGVKEPITKYNNEKIVSGKRFYILKYIENLNKVFSDFKKAKVMIIERKS